MEEGKHIHTYRDREKWKNNGDICLGLKKPNSNHRIPLSDFGLVIFYLPLLPFLPTNIPEVITLALFPIA